MYMCFYNSGEIGNPPFMTQREKPAVRQLKSSGTDSPASDAHLQLPAAVGRRTLSALFTKSEEPAGGKPQKPCCSRLEPRESHSDLVAQDTFSRYHEKRPRCVLHGKP